MFRVLMAVAAIVCSAADRASAQAAPGGSTGQNAVRGPEATCIYNDHVYGEGALICIGPNISEQCVKSGLWEIKSDRKECNSASISK
jgi:hypothetical protein